jgi:hypothetical protein
MHNPRTHARVGAQREPYIRTEQLAVICAIVKPECVTDNASLGGRVKCPSNDHAYWRE